MSYDYKKNIKNAIAEYGKRQSKKQAKEERRKTYGSPESDFVKEFLKWIKQYEHFFKLHVIEAKGVFDPDRQRYTDGNAPKGYPDISGNDKNGTAMYLEAKAPGKRNNLSIQQHTFLKEKIEMNCFAISFDSIEYFRETYKKWQELQPAEQRRFLLAELPMPAKLKKILEEEQDTPLFT